MVRRAATMLRARRNFTLILGLIKGHSEATSRPPGVGGAPFSSYSLARNTKTHQLKSEMLGSVFVSARQGQSLPKTVYRYNIPVLRAEPIGWTNESDLIGISVFDVSPGRHGMAPKLISFWRAIDAGSISLKTDAVL
jgi:hypothetical protein